MICTHCGSTAEHNDDASQFVCQGCGAVLGVQLDADAEISQRIYGVGGGGENVARAPTKAVRVSVFAQLDLTLAESSVDRDTAYMRTRRCTILRTLCSSSMD